MGFFSKEKKEEENIKAAVLNQNSSHLSSLPDLPELPNLSNSQNPNLSEFPTLPELPDYDIKKDIFKDERRAIEIPTPIEKSQLVPSINHLSSITPQLYASSSPIPSTRIMSSQKEPLFIKIEKFQEAIKKFEEIKQKIAEIETSLNQIKEIKNKEGQEINDWENEIRSIKERVRSIDSSLFDKV